MGRIVKIIKTIYGKVDWNIVKTVLLKYLNKKIIIKENNAEIKIDKKFINEYIHSNYSWSAKRKMKNVKANLAVCIDKIIENSGHVKEENNVKDKHNIDASFGFEKYKARFSIKDNNGKIEEYDCTRSVVRCPNFVEKYLYDIVDIKKQAPHNDETCDI